MNSSRHMVTTFAVSDRRPVAFTYAGDRGFLSLDPQYDCEATVAALGAVPAREGTQ